MKKMYKMDIDMRRMGSIQSVFTCDEEEFKSLLGRDIYFGEILGKHSDINIEMEEDFFTELTDDQEFIKKAEEYGIDRSGHVPFDYIDEFDD